MWPTFARRDCSITIRRIRRAASAASSVVTCWVPAAAGERRLYPEPPPRSTLCLSPGKGGAPDARAAPGRPPPTRHIMAAAAEGSPAGSASPGGGVSRRGPSMPEPVLPERRDHLRWMAGVALLVGALYWLCL